MTTLDNPTYCELADYYSDLADSKRRLGDFNSNLGIVGSGLFGALYSVFGRDVGIAVGGSVGALYGVMANKYYSAATAYDDITARLWRARLPPVPLVIRHGTVCF